MTLNVKFSNSQFNKLKSGIKIATEETLKLPSNLLVFLMIGIVFRIDYF